MKIGIFSDVHACLEPLQKALALFEARQVDQVICCGDLVDGANEDDAVVALVQSRAIPTVQGNHDEWLKNDAAHGMVVQKDQTVSFISSLPASLRFEWEGYTLCLAHGTPWKNSTYLFPNSQRERYQQVARAAQADIVILGHTHIPMKIQFEGTWFLNPGSLYYNRTDSSRTCAVLTLPEMQFDVWDVDAGRKTHYETG